MLYVNAPAVHRNVPMQHGARPSCLCSSFACIAALSSQQRQHPCFLIMVFIARILHLRDSALAGGNLSVHCSMNHTLGTGKAKVISHEQPTSSSLVASTGVGLVVAALDVLYAYAIDDCYTITDRGHKHSSGVSEVCFWIRPRRLPNPATLNGDAQIFVPASAPPEEQAHRVLAALDVQPPTPTVHGPDDRNTFQPNVDWQKKTIQQTKAQKPSQSTESRSRGGKSWLRRLSRPVWPV